MPPAIILVVEDEINEQRAIKALLKKFDYDAHVVSSGEEAIIALSRVKCAAILMDINLPGIDGMECTKQIRAGEKEPKMRTPVIGMTARQSSNNRDECLASGMDDYIGRPFSPEQLRRVLLRHVYDPKQPNLKTLKPLFT